MSQNISPGNLYPKNFQISIFLFNVIVMNGLYEYDQGSTIILYWM